MAADVMGTKEAKKAVNSGLFNFGTANVKISTTKAAFPGALIQRDKHCTWGNNWQLLRPS